MGRNLKQTPDSGGWPFASTEEIQKKRRDGYGDSDGLSQSEFLWQIGIHPKIHKAVLMHISLIQYIETQIYICML